eukprot:1881440-Rhodomonas_salina.1
MFSLVSRFAVLFSSLSLTDLPPSLLPSLPPSLPPAPSPSPSLPAGRQQEDHGRQLRRHDSRGRVRQGTRRDLRT